MWQPLAAQARHVWRRQYSLGCDWFQGRVAVMPHADPMLLRLAQCGNPVARLVDEPRDRAGVVDIVVAPLDSENAVAYCGMGQTLLAIIMSGEDADRFDDEEPIARPARWDAAGRPRLVSVVGGRMRWAENPDDKSPGYWAIMRTWRGGVLRGSKYATPLLTRVAGADSNQAGPVSDVGRIFVPGPHMIRRWQTRRGTRWQREREFCERVDAQEQSAVAVSSAHATLYATGLRCPHGWRLAVVRDRRGRCWPANATSDTASGLLPASMPELSPWYRPVGRTW
jgi:hypothetical protein